MNENEEMILDASESFAYGLISEEVYRGILALAGCTEAEANERVERCKIAHAAWQLEQTGSTIQ
jgi:hypothetical protein